MKIPQANKTFVINDKEYTVTKLKARHLINIETAYKDIGDMQKGLRIAALLMLESMGSEALSYEELIEYDLDELAPLLEALSGK